MSRSPRIIVIGALAALGLTGCATVPEKKPEPVVVEAPKPKEIAPDALFAEAVKALEENKLDEAKAALTRVLEKHPENVAARYDLGVIAEKQGSVAEAASHYEAALKLDPNHTPSLLNVGKVYRLQGRFNQAIALYEAALKQPGREYDVKLLNNLAVSYRLAKQYDKAEEALRKLLSRTKDNPDAYKNLALVYYDQGNYRLAEFISGTARKLDEKDPGVYNNLGMIYLKTDQKGLALGQFQKAVELNPNFAPGHMNIGAMALEYRDYQTAEAAFRKALQLDPNSPEAHLFLAWALEGQKGRDPKKGLEAGAAFERYLTWRKDAPDAVCGAGWSYSVEKSGWQKAVDYFEKCLTLATLSDQDKQMIDAKVKGLKMMIAQGQPQPPAATQADKPRAAPTGGQGPSLLDKVSADEAAQEAAHETAPAAGQPGEGGEQPQPAPEGAPAQ